MSCFDASMVHYDTNSPTMRTYRSYMCPSRDSYILPGKGRDVRVKKFHYPWNTNTSHEQDFDSKPPHITKLRNILSETISNITKDSNLKSGESVELTLEIELVKNPVASPTNSLVEVTIIQNKPEENNSIDMDSEKMLEHKFQIERNSYCYSDCPSQKRRNWFDRVIRRYYHTSPVNSELYKNNVRNRQKQVPIPDRKNINANKNKFINVLPEDITTMSADYRKGYRRVSPKRRTFKDSSPGQKQPLVKKISEIFFPTQDVNKNKAIKSVLSDLKKEVDHMNLLAEKDKRKNKPKKKTPVPKLGKLVSNIFADVMENCNEPDCNDKSSVPIHYKSFYEPVEKNKIKKDTKNRIITTGFSRSDTCIAVSTSRHAVKSSRSVNDCNRLLNFPRKQMNQCQVIGDSRQTSSKIKTKYERKENRHCPSRNEKGDGRRKRYKDKSKHHLKKSKINKSLSKKYSAINWNGQTYEVKKEVKKRIEQIIVNELQNLALKEGMECDFSPLPSTTDDSVYSVKAVKKISSFICELDISDNQLKKDEPHKEKNLVRKASYTVQKKRSSKILKRSSNNKNQKVNAEKAAFASISPDKAFRDSSIPATSQLSTSKSECECHTIGNYSQERPSTVKKLDPTKDGFEITYVNTNTSLWSDESVVKYSSENEEINHSILENNTVKPKNTDLTDLTFTHFSSGFVKRINSNDSTWNDVPIGAVKRTEECCSEMNKVSKQIVNEESTRKTTKVNSATSNECEKNIQIELDMEDLETILNEAKYKQDAGKILINAKCKQGAKKYTRSREFTGKNSTSYTDYLLMKAAERLEKYRRSKL